MILGHSIALDATAAQQAQFRRACGVARYSWNWSLAKWKEMHAAGEKPSAHKIKALWNAHRKAELPWTYEVSKCCSAQPILDLGVAFSNFFRDLKKPKGARKSRFPRFKSKRDPGSFALYNDQFQIKGDRVRIPRVGWVRMHEPLRFTGKIMGARVSRIGTRWHISIQVDVGDATMPAAAGDAVGIDLGITTLMQLSRPLPDGSTAIANPRARRSLMKRQTKLARRISRQELQRRKTNAKTSKRQMIRRDRLARLHYRIACVRKDAIHKSTTRIANAFSTVVLEDLNVAGMAKNKRLAGSILDASPMEIRRQIEYKVAMRGGRVVIADRWFPSSKACSACGAIADKMPLSVRAWTCPCGADHDRDENAAKNLEFLLVGPARAEPLTGDRSDTRGEIRALAGGQPPTKLRSATRELQPVSRHSGN